MEGPDQNPVENVIEPALVSWKLYQDFVTRKLERENQATIQWAKLQGMKKLHSREAFRNYIDYHLNPDSFRRDRTYEEMVAMADRESSLEDKAQTIDQIIKKSQQRLEAENATDWRQTKRLIDKFDRQAREKSRADRRKRRKEFFQSLRLPGLSKRE